MSDIVGRLFREFAITLAVAILISAVVSLTLTPMMCARLLKAEAKIKHNRFEKGCEIVFDKMIVIYGAWLKRILNHEWIILAIAVSTLLLTALLYMIISRVFPLTRQWITARCNPSTTIELLCRNG